jgi:hypothetical protein
MNKILLGSVFVVLSMSSVTLYASGCEWNVYNGTKEVLEVSKVELDYQGGNGTSTGMASKPAEITHRRIFPDHPTERFINLYSYGEQPITAHVTIQGEESQSTCTLHLTCRQGGGTSTIDYIGFKNCREQPSNTLEVTDYGYIPGASKESNKFGYIPGAGKK